MTKIDADVLARLYRLWCMGDELLVACRKLCIMDDVATLKAAAMHYDMWEG